MREGLSRRMKVRHSRTCGKGHRSALNKAQLIEIEKMNP